MEANFVYSVAHGSLFLSCGSMLVSIGKGYSGFREYRNNAAFETRKALGPIPRGRWLVGFGASHPRLGPVAIPLQPEDVPALSGRSGFYIHGDNSKGDFSASTGCIILPRSARDCIDHLSRWSGVRTLIVADRLAAAG